MILASSTQRAVAVAIAFVVLAAWAVYLILENRRSTSDIVSSYLNAPNRKAPPDDEVFEGRRLDRFLTAALVGTSVLAVGLPLYWLGEPGREKGALIGFDKREVRRGMENYEAIFLCNNCHGPEGGGGVAAYTVTDYDANGQPKTNPATGKAMVRVVQWKAPRINNIGLRYKAQQITNVLNCGRGGAKNNPMPAWGVTCGGPGSDQQISDLVSLLRYWSIDNDPVAKKVYEEAYKANGRDSAKAYELAFTSAAKAAQEASQKALDDEKKNAADLLAKIGTDKDPLVAAQKALADAKAAEDVVATAAAETALKEMTANIEHAKKTVTLSDGEILFNQNCARCHTNGYSYGEPKAQAGGFYGPSLRKSSLTNQFPDAAKQAEFIKHGVVDGAAYGSGGVNHWAGGGMAYFGNVLTDEMIDKIVAYERGLE